MAPAHVKHPPKESESKLKNAYLILYNSFLVVGWGLVLLKAVAHIYHSKTGLYKEVEFWLKVSQTAALLELFHSLFGLVRSSIFTALLQVASRIFVLWVVLDPLVMKDGSVKETIGFPMLLFAWSITEIIRYSYYANAILDTIPYVLQWCRYSFFIILYPLGVAGELICIHRSMPFAKKTGKFSFPLPNKMNFGIDYVSTCYAIFLLYGPGFYHLYSFMLRQRKKIIGAKQKDE